MRYRWLSVTPAVTVMSTQSQQHFTRTRHWLYICILYICTPMLVLVFAFAVCTAAQTLHKVTQCDLSCTSQLSLCWVCANTFTEGGCVCGIRQTAASQHIPLQTLPSPFSNAESHTRFYDCIGCPKLQSTHNTVTASTGFSVQLSHAST